MKHLLRRDETKNVEIYVVACRKPHKGEEKTLLHQYFQQPHHVVDYPERNREIVISAVKRDGFLTLDSFDITLREESL
jgi:hypothetical protein